VLGLRRIFFMGDFLVFRSVLRRMRRLGLRHGFTMLSSLRAPLKEPILFIFAFGAAVPIVEEVCAVAVIINLFAVSSLLGLGLFLSYIGCLCICPSLVLVSHDSIASAVTLRAHVSEVFSLLFARVAATIFSFTNTVIRVSSWVVIFKSSFTSAPGFGFGLEPGNPLISFLLGSGCLSVFSFLSGLFNNFLGFTGFDTVLPGPVIVGTVSFLRLFGEPGA